MFKEWIDINHFTNNSATLDNIKHKKKPASYKPAQHKGAPKTKD